jgi:hypothetical protein
VTSRCVVGALLMACAAAPQPGPTPRAAPTPAPTVPTTTAAPATAVLPTPAGPAPTAAPTATPSVPPAAPPTPAATPSPAPAVDGSPPYLDDRSTPEQVLRSYFNAIERRELARAYGYWQENAPGLPPFPRFEQGYADTASVQAVLGSRRTGVGAGQLYFSVPVALIATTRSGATQRFVGCYVLHLARPQLQAVPPFHPMAIQSATVRELPPDQDPTAQLGSVCPPS